jgi:hypothetical protein
MGGCKRRASRDGLQEGSKQRVGARGEQAESGCKRRASRKWVQKEEESEHG